MVMSLSSCAIQIAHLAIDRFALNEERLPGCVRGALEVELAPDADVDDGQRSGSVADEHAVTS
jgi:hypothetical protein